MRAHVSVGTSSEVSLKVTETDISQLTATIKSPSGIEEPCMLKRLANGHLGISFTPREVGAHLVNVYRHGEHIPNSPFKIFVGETEIGNASKVKVYGRGISEGMANEVNEFFVNTKDAGQFVHFVLHAVGHRACSLGYGGLSLSIEGPSKADIECHDNEDGSCRVTYKPTEPGTYIVNVKFADEHVPGMHLVTAGCGNYFSVHRQSIHGEDWRRALWSYDRAHHTTESGRGHHPRWIPVRTLAENPRFVRLGVSVDADGCILLQAPVLMTWRPP